MVSQGRDKVAYGGRAFFFQQFFGRLEDGQVVLKVPVLLGPSSKKFV